MKIDLERLEDILEAIDKIEKISTKIKIFLIKMS